MKNRDIKFKIWYPDSNIMHGPLSIDLFYIRNSVHPLFQSSDKKIYLQYTGLKDKNGVEICEGDIIVVEKSCPIFGIIVYKSFGFFIEYFYERGNLSYNPNFYYSYDKESLLALSVIRKGIEVKGNIYQSHELVTELGIKLDDVLI